MPLLQRRPAVFWVALGRALLDRSREGVLPLCSALVRPIWSPELDSGIVVQEKYEDTGGKTNEE